MQFVLCTKQLPVSVMLLVITYYQKHHIHQEFLHPNLNIKLCLRNFTGEQVPPLTLHIASRSANQGLQTVAHHNMRTSTIRQVILACNVQPSTSLFILNVPSNYSHQRKHKRAWRGAISYKQHHRLSRKVFLCEALIVFRNQISVAVNKSFREFIGGNWSCYVIKLHGQHECVETRFLLPHWQLHLIKY